MTQNRKLPAVSDFLTSQPESSSVWKLNAKFVLLCVVLTVFGAVFNNITLYFSFTHTASCTNFTKILTKFV
jgi:hypothetical protein